jgi:biliverdin reductase
MSAEGRVRWAILGVGTAGFARAKAILRDPRSELVAVYRGHKAAETRVLPVDSVLEAIELADVVAIASPSGLHPSQVRAVLKAGRHAVVEYPLAPTEEMAAGLFGLARERGRVLHVEHIELLSGAARILASNVRAITVKRARVTFEGRGPEGIPGGDLAIGNVARIHRLVDVTGPLLSVDEVHQEPGRLAARVTLQNGAPGEMAFERGPYYARRTVFEVEDHNDEWRMENFGLYRRNVPQTILEAVPLFEQDHAWAMRRIADEEPRSYVDEERILHVMRVVDMLREGRTGKIA